jgi:hypothetical protein
MVTERFPQLSAAEDAIIAARFQLVEGHDQAALDSILAAARELVSAQRELEQWLNLTKTEAR